MRTVVWLLFAVVAIIGAGPLAVAAAPTSPPPGPGSGLLGALSGLTSGLPPVHVTAGKGSGAVDVTVDAGATVRRVLGTTRSTPPSDRKRPPTTSARVPASSRPGTHHTGVAARPEAGQASSRVTAGGRGRPVPHRPTAHRAVAAAPTARADGPFSTPSRAVQTLLHLSLGSDEILLVILGMTMVGALAAMGTVVSMGRRPGRHRATSN